MTLITHDACVFVCFTTPLFYCEIVMCVGHMRLLTFVSPVQVERELI